MFFPMFCDCNSAVNSLLCALVLRSVRSWFKFYFVLFLAMVIYESEFETKRLKCKQRIEMGRRMYITEREAEIRFFFVSQTGQETTSAMLAFMLAEVGKHPEVEER